MKTKVIRGKSSLDDARMAAYATGASVGYWSADTIEIPVVGTTVQTLMGEVAVTSKTVARNLYYDLAIENQTEVWSPYEFLPPPLGYRKFKFLESEFERGFAAGVAKQWREQGGGKKNG